MKPLFLLPILTLITSSAFASVTTYCTGKIGSRGSASVSLTTAADDNQEGVMSVTLFSGMPTAMPIHYQMEVVQTQNSDPDSDVSVKYQPKTGHSGIRFKLNENPAMGASYIVNLPGYKKIPLSCKAHS